MAAIAARLAAMALLFRLLVAPFRLSGRTAMWWSASYARGGGSAPTRPIDAAMQLASATAALGTLVLFGAAIWAMLAGETGIVVLSGAAGTVAAAVAAALWTRR